MVKKTVIAIACATLSLPVLAAEKTTEKVDLSKIDKSHYTLFSPTPGMYLREMSNDRPDKTESASP